jgi:hypothetical protein
MGTSDQRSGRGAAGSTDMISRRSSFGSRLDPKSPSPLKMTLTVFGIAECPPEVVAINCRMIGT